MRMKILGLKGKIEDIDAAIEKIKKYDCVIQLMDARAIGGKRHVKHAVIHALNAMKRNENIANDLGIEICVRTAGERQISKALDIVGIKDDTEKFCAVFLGCDEDIIEEFIKDFGFEKNNEVLKPNESYLKKLYNLGKEVEVVGVENALIERTTLLTIEV